MLLKRILPLYALSFLIAAPVFAAGDDGGFGAPFTSETPAALAEESATDFSADAVSKIEPAAGETIWLPEEDVSGEGTDAVIPMDEKILMGPDRVLIPGMDASPKASPETVN